MTVREARPSFTTEIKEKAPVFLIGAFAQESHRLYPTGLLWPCLRPIRLIYFRIARLGQANALKC